MVQELSVVVTGEDRDVKQVFEEVKKVKSYPIHLELVALGSLKEALKRIRPQLVIYDTNGNPETVKKTAAEVAEEFLDIHWAVVSKETDIDIALQFFRLGATDFLRQPVRSDDVRRLIHKVVDVRNRRDANGKDTKRFTVALFSPKGGVGLTTVASNLAVELAQKKTGSVLLLDLVMQHGNVADLLDIPSKYTFMDVLENFERLDANLLENTIAKHRSGCSILPCPKQPEDEDLIGSGQTSEIFQFLKGSFQYVIADVGHEFTKTAICFLDLSDLVLVVTTPDVPSLTNTRNALGTFNRLGYGPEKVKVVLNRHRMKGEVDASIIEKTLAMKLFFRLPDDPLTCLTAINQGKTLDEITKNGDLEKGIQGLLSQVLDLTRKGNRHVAS